MVEANLQKRDRALVWCGAPSQGCIHARRRSEAQMSSGIIHWGGYGGDHLELVMAVLVAQDHPNVMRRVPASGDGGIDLMIPMGDGYIVEQIKGLTGRVDADAKKQ